MVVESSMRECQKNPLKDNKIMNPIIENYHFALPISVVLVKDGGATFVASDSFHFSL